MCLGWHHLAPWGQTLHIFCRVFSSAVHIAIPPIFNKTIASFNLLVLSCLFAGNNAFGSPKILVGVNSNFILRILVIKKLQKCACHAFPCYPRSKMTKLTRRIIGNNAKTEIQYSIYFIQITPTRRNAGKRTQKTKEPTQ